MDNNISVRPINSKKEKLDFIKFQWRVYDDYPLWVPPLIIERKMFLNPKTNSFFNHGDVQLFMAYKDSRPVGRIAAVENRMHNETHDDKVGFFGLFESVEDDQVAGALFEAAGGWLKERNMRIMRGPMSFSTHDECGLLVDGFETPPMVMMPYNPPYYEKLLADYGFKRNSDSYAFKIERDTAQPPPDNVYEMAEATVKDPEVKIGDPAKIASMDEVGRGFKKLYNEGFKKNWGYTPTTDEQVSLLLKAYKYMADKRFAFFAKVGDDPGAFAVWLPNYNRALKKMNGRVFPFGWLWLIRDRFRYDALRIWVVTVSPKFRGQGLFMWIYAKSFDRIMKRKLINLCEFSWIHEHNKWVIAGLEWAGMVKYKTFRFFDYDLK